MADRLNGADGRRAAQSRLLRVVFAAGTAPTGPGGAVAAAGGASAATAGGASAATTEHAPDPVAAVLEVDGTGRVTVDGEQVAAILDELEPPRARLLVTRPPAAPEEHQVLVTSLPAASGAATGVRRVEVVLDGWRFELDVDSEARASLRERATSARADAARGGPSELRAIIPGRVVSVEVAEGDAVEPGGRLLVLEAMKMQNEVRAPRAGTVARVAVAPGQTVELGDLLVVLE
jgi:biotin carboxyl carrier protein